VALFNRKDRELCRTGLELEGRPRRGSQHRLSGDHHALAGTGSGFLRIDPVAASGVRSGRSM